MVTKSDLLFNPLIELLPLYSFMNAVKAAIVTSRLSKDSLIRSGGLLPDAVRRTMMHSCEAV